MTSNNQAFFAHETACIDDGAEIGAGTRVWHFSHIMPNCKIDYCAERLNLPLTFESTSSCECGACNRQYKHSKAGVLPLSLRTN